MVRYKKSTGNIKVTADKIKYEVLGDLAPMDMYIIEDIIKTRDDVVIEGDNRALTLILGLESNLNLDIEHNHSDSLKIELIDLDTKIMDLIEDYYNPW